MEAVSEYAPDVALLDIEMPGGSGLDAAEELRAAHPGLKVVVLTTFGRPGYLRRAMEAGADAFLVKDAPAAELAGAVRRVLGGERVIDWTDVRSRTCTIRILMPSRRPPPAETAEPVRPYPPVARQEDTVTQDVSVIIGVGGMGQAIARRVAPGSHLLLADFDTELLDSAAEQLTGEGHALTPQRVDVSERDSVVALAEKGASLGAVRTIVHTAGLSPSQGSVPAILAVDLLGVALVLEEFGNVVATGGAGLVISSSSAYQHPGFTSEEARALTTTPAGELLSLPLAAPGNFPHSGAAYPFAKRANQLQVQAASTTWGTRGARVNSLSPGIISTPMGQQELAGQHGHHMEAMINASNAKRLGTPADIASAAEYLLSPAAAFISGVDLLVDGGSTAALRR